MNIVQVRHFADPAAKRYTYNVPAGVHLTKGDIVLVKNSGGKEVVAQCVSNSEDLSDNAIDMIMSGSKVISNVIGKYSLVEFNKTFEF